MVKKLLKKPPRITEMNLEGFPWRPKECKGRKSKPQQPHKVVERVPKRRQSYHKESKMKPKLPKETEKFQKEANMQPKGAKREPKRSQVVPKGNQKAAKMHPKIDFGAMGDLVRKKCSAGHFAGPVGVQNP